MNPSGRYEQLARSRLYLVCGARRPDLASFLDEVLRAGVDIVQIREKDAEDRDLLSAGEVFREAAQRHDALFIVNDRPDLAVALDADGVHLGQDDVPVGIARQIVGGERLIGLSTHSAAQLEDASADADYLCAGPVWETPTKPGRPASGLGLIEHAAGHVQTPWFAIGGIGPENVGEVAAAGAHRIVVVRALTGAADPANAVAALLAPLG